jgi:hypothetical protein
MDVLGQSYWYMVFPLLCAIAFNFMGKYIKKMIYPSTMDIA